MPYNCTSDALCQFTLFKWWNEKDIKKLVLVCHVVLPGDHGSDHVGAGGEVSGCAHAQPHMLYVHLQIFKIFSFYVRY